MLKVQKFPGHGALADLTIPPSAGTQVYSDGLKAGKLLLQRCAACGRARNPHGPICPYCRATQSRWVESSGRGIVFSWVRYPRSYVPHFEPLVPYTVLCVEIDNGPRIFGRLADSDRTPRIGEPVTAIIEEWEDGGRAPAFVLLPAVAS